MSSSAVPNISQAVIGRMIRSHIKAGGAGGDLMALPSGGSLVPLPYGGGFACGQSMIRRGVAPSQHFKYIPSADGSAGYGM